MTAVSLLPAFIDFVNEQEQFCILVGEPDVHAIELVYDGVRRVVDEGKLSRSIEAATYHLRRYKRRTYRDRGLTPPSYAWATMRPVDAEYRERQLRYLREAARL
jgi:hypothetical protein